MVSTLRALAGASQKWCPAVWTSRTLELSELLFLVHTQPQAQRHSKRKPMNADATPAHGMLTATSAPSLRAVGGSKPLTPAAVIISQLVLTQGPRSVERVLFP